MEELMNTKNTAGESERQRYFIDLLREEIFGLPPYDEARTVEENGADSDKRLSYHIATFGCPIV